MTLRQLRDQFEALKRKYARVIAMAHAKTAADQIVELWNIALAKGQPRPDPVSCIKKFIDAGLRMPGFKAVLTYLKDIKTYGGFPEAGAMAEMLFPPGKKVDLNAVLPRIY